MTNSRSSDTFQSTTLEWPCCPSCQANDPRPLHTVWDFTTDTRASFVLVQCGQCGLWYLRPRPTPAVLARYYSAAYRPFRRSGIMGQAYRAALLREVHALWPYLAPPRRVLDVGCGDGTLLQIIREAGNPQVAGLEPSEHAATHAREHLQLDVTIGTLETAHWPANTFDTVLLRHVLEHLPEPAHALKHIGRLLRPGGHLILWVPNCDSWAAQWLKRYWIGYDPPRHLVTFSTQTLRQLLIQQGFHPRSIAHEWYGIEWSWGIRLWLHQRLRAGRQLTQILGWLHPGITLASTPLSALAAARGRSGRIRVVAQRLGTR